MTAKLTLISLSASGICPQALSDILNLALSIVLVWCRDFELSLNPSKTDMILFTRTYRIPDLSHPSISGTRLMFSAEVKYLGLMRDPKLSWEANLAARARKATCATYLQGSYARFTLWPSNPTSWIGMIGILDIYTNGSKLRNMVGSTATYRGTAGWTNSPVLLYSFRNPLRLNWVWQLHRSSWPLGGNTFGPPTYPRINVESFSTARLTWPLMDRKRINQLLGLGRHII